MGFGTLAGLASLAPTSAHAVQVHVTQAMNPYFRGYQRALRQGRQAVAGASATPLDAVVNLCAVPGSDRLRPATPQRLPPTLRRVTVHMAEKGGSMVGRSLPMCEEIRSCGFPQDDQQFIDCAAGL
jgi:hypothetical protein